MEFVKYTPFERNGQETPIPVYCVLHMEFVKYTKFERNGQETPILVFCVLHCGVCEIHNIWDKWTRCNVLANSRDRRGPKQSVRLASGYYFGPCGCPCQYAVVTAIWIGLHKRDLFQSAFESLMSPAPACGGVGCNKVRNFCLEWPVALFGSYYRCRIAAFHAQCSPYYTTTKSFLIWVYRPNMRYPTLQQSF